MPNKLLFKFYLRYVATCFRTLRGNFFIHPDSFDVWKKEFNRNYAIIENQKIVITFDDDLIQGEVVANNVWEAETIIEDAKHKPIKVYDETNDEPYGYYLDKIVNLTK